MFLFISLLYLNEFQSINSVRYSDSWILYLLRCNFLPIKLTTITGRKIFRQEKKSIQWPYQVIVHLGQWQSSWSYETSFHTTTINNIIHRNRNLLKEYIILWRNMTIDTLQWIFKNSTTHIHRSKESEK